MDPRRSLPTLLFAASLAGACTRDPTAPTAQSDLSAPWPVSTPVAQGFDRSALASAVEHARTLPRLLSLVIVRNGTLVAEHYFNGNHVDSLNDVRSVTKSVVATLVGAAIEREDLTDLDLPIGPLLDVDHRAGLPPEKGAVSIRQLLTMGSGFQWHELDGTNREYNAWVGSADPVGHLLARPIVTTPGTAFNYNSAAVHLLSVALANAVGQPLPAFADVALFRPLGIDRVRWEVLADGSPNGGSGIRLRPRDLAKIGALWLQGGHSGASRILAGEYVANGTTAQYGLQPSGTPLGRVGYGYLWWVAQPSGGAAFLAWGYGGQFIFVSPAKALVVVVTTEWRGAASQANQLELNGLDLIVNRVLRAAR